MQWYLVTSPLLFLADIYKSIYSRTCGRNLAWNNKDMSKCDKLLVKEKKCFSPLSKKISTDTMRYKFHLEMDTE